MTGSRDVATFEFLVEATTACNAEGTYEFLEVDCAVLVLVKDVEHIVCKLPWVAKGEELLVYSGKL